MRSILFAALIIFCSTTFVFAQNSSSRVFPPDNCPVGQQRVITWQNGAPATECSSGQDVLNLAIPVCNDGQAVVRDNGQFVCKTVSGASVPTCDTNQFLTYNGTTFQCAATQNLTLTLPVCGADQVVTSDGSSLTCTAQAASASTGSWCGMRLAECITFDPNRVQYGQLNISCNGQALTVKACGATYGPEELKKSYRVSEINCPAGYQGVFFDGVSSLYYWDIITCVKK